MTNNYIETKSSLKVCTSEIILSVGSIHRGHPMFPGTSQSQRSVPNTDHANTVSLANHEVTKNVLLNKYSLIKGDALWKNVLFEKSVLFWNKRIYFFQSFFVYEFIHSFIQFIQVFIGYLLCTRHHPFSTVKTLCIPTEEMLYVFEAKNNVIT